MGPTALVFGVCQFLCCDLYDVGWKRDGSEYCDCGAAGAFPPMTVGDGDGSCLYREYLLFSIIFFWTPPHFGRYGVVC